MMMNIVTCLIVRRLSARLRRHDRSDRDANVADGIQFRSVLRSGQPVDIQARLSAVSR